MAQKIPYKFSYVFEDDAGQQSKLMVEDWEVGQLYLNCLWRSSGNQMEALKKVKRKYFDWMIKRDMYLILGTTLKFHKMAPNPFIVIGVFYPPFPSAHKQMSLFDWGC